MNDSMEQTLKKVINDIDLQGDDEMVFIENREQGIEDYGEEGMRCLEDLIWTNKDFQNVIESATMRTSTSSRTSLRKRKGLSLQSGMGSWRDLHRLSVLPLPRSFGLNWETYASTTTSVSMPNGASILPARPARRFGSISRRNSEKTALRWQGSWESSLGRKGLIRRWGFQTWQPTSRTLLSTITTNLAKGMAIWTMVRISYLHLKQGFYSS